MRETRSDSSPGTGTGLVVESYCSVRRTSADPFETVEWSLRSAAIKDENGDVLL